MDSIMAKIFGLFWDKFDKPFKKSFNCCLPRSIDFDLIFIPPVVPCSTSLKFRTGTDRYPYLAFSSSSKLGFWVSFCFFISWKHAIGNGSLALISDLARSRSSSSTTWILVFWFNIFFAFGIVIENLPVDWFKNPKVVYYKWNKALIKRWANAFNG